MAQIQQFDIYYDLQSGEFQRYALSQQQQVKLEPLANDTLPPYIIQKPYQLIIPQGPGPAITYCQRVRAT
jgi:hypothetical protein